MATSTLADVALTGAWVNLVATHASLGSADATLQNAGAGAIAVVFGGADPTALGSSGIVLGPRDKISGTAAAVWARAIDDRGKVSIVLGANGPMTQAEMIAALKSSTATHSSVASGIASATILAANANRKGALIMNTDANDLYLDLTGGTAAATTRAQKKLAQNESYEVPSGYTGAITGIWSADGAGFASVAEFT